MKDVFVTGIGAVSPAGWGLRPFREALASGHRPAATNLPRPGTEGLRVLRVPPANPRPSFISDPRLRRASPISHYAVAAALEALGASASAPDKTGNSLGVVFCVMTGCVNYSRRFYDEVLKDPSTASPLVFPETVLNAPASHLAALLGTQEVSYTLVGDPSVFVQGLAVAAEWLLEERVQRCVIVGAEEMDWLVTEGVKLFDSSAVVSEGAGALCLELAPKPGPAIKLSKISAPRPYVNGTSRKKAARAARAEIENGLPASLLCDGLQGGSRFDSEEAQAWSDWKGLRLSPKKVLGEGLAAASAWQCVAAVDALHTHSYTAANVSVVGLNEQAIAAQFVRA